MKKLSKKKKLQKRHLIPVIGVSGLVLYLVVASAYFNFKQYSAHIPWPNNNLIYQFNESADTNKLYIALGDSLTYGFGAMNYEDSYTYRVANHLAANGQGITLKDYSYPGFRTNDVIEKLDTVAESKPDIITLFIGVNDTHKLIELNSFAKNYDKLLHRLTSENNAKIYVINVPYLGAPSVQLPPYNYYFDARARSHNSTIKALAQKYNVSYIDLYGPTLELFKSDGKHYSKDAYHPSAEGYKLWANIITNDISR